MLSLRTSTLVSVENDDGVQCHWNILALRSGGKFCILIKARPPCFGEQIPGVALPAAVE